MIYRKFYKTKIIETIKKDTLTEIITNGLVLSLHFDEGSGNIAYDSSGYNNHGKLVNGPTWVDGKFEKALSFDGVDDYVEINNSPTLNPTNDGFTISFWMRLNRYVSPGAIIAKRTDLNNGYFVFISNTYMFFDWGGYTISRWNTGFVPELNRWYFIVLIQNSSGRFLYVDGNLFSFTTNKGDTTLASTTAPLRIFADSAYARYFNDG
ncbi:MAG: LamG domain-containing protein, partial [Nitrososphaerota archaeon]